MQNYDNLSSGAATLVFFDHSGAIIHINISTSVGVEPTNAACAPSTAASGILNYYTIEASPKKDAQVAYITTPDAAVHSVYGFYLNYFLCRIMVFLSSVAATLVFFDHSGDIIHINISTSVGVEPTNAACAPSTAASGILNHYIIEVSQKKDAQVAYITTPDAAVHSVYGFYLNYFLCRIIIFLSSVAATLVFFDHSGDIIHINISTSVGVEPTNAACAPSTAASDVLNHYRMLK